MTFLLSTSRESDGPYLSPSSIETFDLCARKWAWVKIDGLPRPGSAATDLGSAVHAQHEAYLRDGTPYDTTTRAGEIAIATAHLLPPPGTVAVEEFIRVKHRGVDFGGYVDAHGSSPNGIIAYVYDHKTGARPEYFKLTLPQLLDHPQAPIYGLWAHEHYGPTNLDGVEFRWNYATTRGRPTAYQSHHATNGAACKSALDAFFPVAERMLAVLQKRDEGKITTARQLPLPVAKDGRSPCEAYGGCPFRAQCNLTTKEIYQMADTKLPNPFARKPAAPTTAPASPPPAAAAINPPEGDAPAAETTTHAEPPKRGPGRPPKAKPAEPGPEAPSVPTSDTTQIAALAYADGFKAGVAFAIGRRP